jgi:hypothetical protein
MHDSELASFLAIAKVAIDRVQIEVEPGGVAFTGAPNLFNNPVLRHGALVSQQLLGCAENGRFESFLAAQSLDVWAHLSVGDVSAIPGQKVLHAVCGSNGDVHRVCFRPAGNRPPVS